MICTIDSKPVAKGRPRLGRYGTYTPKKTVEYERLIKEEFIKQCKGKYDSEYLGAVSIKMNFYFQPPKNTSKKMMLEICNTPRLKKPDLDNLEKAILDALNGIAWHDDNQVYKIETEKLYAKEDRIVIEVVYEN